MFGGRINHLVQYARGGESYLENQYAQEKQRLIQKVTSPPFPQKLWTSKDESFCRILDALLEAEYNILSVDDLVTKANVTREEIYRLAKEDFLYLLPGLSSPYLQAFEKSHNRPAPKGSVVKVTNPLFMKCWRDYREVNKS